MPIVPWGGGTPFPFQCLRVGSAGISRPQFTRKGPYCSALLILRPVLLHLHPANHTPLHSPQAPSLRLTHTLRPTGPIKIPGSIRLQEASPASCAGEGQRPCSFLPQGTC